MIFRLLFVALLCLVPSILYADGFKAMLMPGPVIEGHAKVEHECERCHRPFDKKGQKDLCNDCHKDVRQDYIDMTGMHGRQADDECRNCHDEHKGRDFHSSNFDKTKFDHEKTDFQLRNSHSKPGIGCEKCHAVNKKFRDAPHACIGCHRKDDVHKAAFGERCADCHNDMFWTKVSFDHTKTDFQLVGKHQDTKCKDCHRNTEFGKTPKQCFQCHREDDKHKTKFGEKCGDCHVEQSWKQIRFQHDRDVEFKLRGSHADVKCVDCHRGHLYDTKTPTNCLACHRDDDNEKGHKGKFGEKCEKCHTESKWKEHTFLHDRDTKYRLLDSHKSVKCSACHRGNLFIEKTNTNCISCHKKDDDEKGHRGRFGDKCEKCHQETKWKKIIFDHDKDTKYSLIGKHRKVKCDDCHVDNLYQKTVSADCISCHKKHDKHQGQLGSRCENCHNENDWKKTRFDHDLAKFPLLGKHKKLACTKCHDKLTYKDAKSNCIACHDKDDRHKKTLTEQCERCHSATSWSAWRFDHDRDTKFNLDGSHRQVGCNGCHRKPVKRIADLSMDCFSCHLADDVHNGNYGKACIRCHNTSKFKEVRIH